MATDIGKVGIVMKGDWSSSATYEVLDAVSYENGLYIAKYSVPAGTEPTNTTYWQKAITTPPAKTAINLDQTINPSPVTLAYTGASVTIPANCYYAFAVELRYGANPPLQVALAQIPEGTLNNRNTYSKPVDLAHTNFCGMTGNTAITFYIWGQWSGSGSNRVLVNGWYEPKA